VACASEWLHNIFVVFVVVFFLSIALISTLFLLPNIFIYRKRLFIITGGVDPSEDQPSTPVLV
ncbi:hypothetical protein CPB86DRAFT_789371, partial [Serendipita vermifera]